MLVRDRSDAPELFEVRRFQKEWEKEASLLLRCGDPLAVDAYEANGRIHEGEMEAMLERAYDAWRRDLVGGKATLLVGESNETVLALNSRARLDLLVEGTVSPRGSVPLHDGSEASTGDLIISRQNDRRLMAGKRWVKNGDRWIVDATRPDGSIVARRRDRRDGRIVLPAWYVSEHVELGYAVTAHRAQGATVDTAHVIVSPLMTREALYVALTRGRESNVAYVATDRPDDMHQPPHPSDADGTDARSVLFGVLQHSGAELSAHETLRSEQEAWSNIAQLAAEYETLASSAQRDRWIAAMETSGLQEQQVQAVISSDAFGPLTAELRRAEASGYDIDSQLPRIVSDRGLGDAQDIAAVLRDRVAHASTRRTGSTQKRPATRFIAGIIPEALGPMDAEMRQALDERRELIEQRAKALASEAIRDPKSWARTLGTQPNNPTPRARWADEVRVVATYRDRYQIKSRDVLGAVHDDRTRQRDRNRAAAALHRARDIAKASSANEMAKGAHRNQDFQRL